MLSRRVREGTEIRHTKRRLLKRSSLHSKLRTLGIKANDEATVDDPGMCLCASLFMTRAVSVES